MIKLLLIFNLLMHGQFAISGEPIVPKKNAADNTILIASLEIPPYVIANSERDAHGILVDMIRFIAADAHLQINFVILPWLRALAQTENGQCDAVIPTIKNKERAKLLNFYKPITAFKISLFNIKTKNQFRGNYSDLKGKVIARIRGQSGGAVFDNTIKKDKISIIETSTFRQSIATLLANKTQYALIPKLAGQYIARSEKPKLAIEPSVNPVGEIDMYVAFTKIKNGKSALRDKFNISLHKLLDNGMLQKKKMELIKEYGF